MTTLNPGLEGITVSRWVYQTLTADQALQDALGGPQEAARRVVEGAYAGGGDLWITWTVIPDWQDVKGVGAVQIMSRVQFQMKVVGKGTSYAPLLPVYQRAHELLESKVAQEPSGGGLILTAHRVSGVQYPERANGIEYRHLGGLYEAETQ